MDTATLKRTWTQVTQAGDDVALFFYSHLFLTNPQVRDMFPVSMATQRDRLVGALGHIVSNVDTLEDVTAYVQQLGRDHRRFSVVPEHYGAVGASLLATLQHFLGNDWTPEVAADWSAAYGVVSTAMVQAAEESADTSPAVWEAEVLSTQRRSLDISVLQVRPHEALPFEPGQSLAVQIPQRPRVWRYLSPANAPRDDTTIELHVQAVPGGQMSGPLVRSVRPGDVLRLGAPVGQALTLPDDDKRDLVLVAGGTGLAPLRAVLEHLDHRRAAGEVAPSVHLFHGARLPWNLYEDALLRGLAARSWFTYVPVVSDDPTFPGARGLVGAVAAAHQDWGDRLALVCGSPAMVAHTAGALASAGLPRADIRAEAFGPAASAEPSSTPQPATNESGDPS